jgi:uncharacterized RmlC-like cupin family protein
VDDRVTINEARNEPQANSLWHHHGENTGYVYVLRGRLRVEWGPGGRDIVDLARGDFYAISPNTIHREANPGTEDQVLIAFVVGSGSKFVNVDGPEPERGSTQTGSIRVIRSADIPVGPKSHGMARKVADLDELVSLGEARNEPQTRSAWHHHGERTACAYVAQGRARLEWGPGGRERADLAAGDFYVISPNTTHREGNPGADDQLLVGFYLGHGPRVVNVDGPEPA